jgi:hypothetical protein
LKDQLDQALGVGGSAVRIDVPAVGLHRHRQHVGAELREDHRCRPVAGTVRAVEGDADAREIELERGSKLPYVVVEGPLEHPNSADPLPGLLVHTPLDLELPVVIELGAVTIEELDPVVGERVVRGRDDRRQIEAQASGEDRRGGRRQDAAEHRVPATRGDSGGQGLLQHRPRLAGVAHDQELGTLGLCHQGGGSAQAHGQIGCEQIAHGPPYPIGPEQLALD